ncbi:unnamed protein product [Ectocarpus sp. 8 AP-2014]|uniref:Dynein light chain n=1 Tax=Ectocarpus siliculosus TaxID=2880 RepID=D7G4Z5_ECTSI|nr:hypothetical protein Esi_0592_0002 [Ectocarpus siliculosus]|eukprot:CBJ33758.1 hypothetical protein Esi_0592_0002 [Ectocarpus siliculosus]
MESSGVSAKMVSDMDDHGEMRVDAQNWAAAAIESKSDEKEISRAIKSKFEVKYGPTWHCIVGTDFKAFVTHESKHFVFFYHGKMAFCLYKAG